MNLKRLWQAFKIWRLRREARRISPLINAMIARDQEAYANKPFIYRQSPHPPPLVREIEVPPGCELTGETFTSPVHIILHEGSAIRGCTFIDDSGSPQPWWGHWLTPHQEDQPNTSPLLTFFKDPTGILRPFQFTCFTLAGDPSSPRFIIENHFHTRTPHLSSS